jgi:hypothetical protein
MNITASEGSAYKTFMFCQRKFGDELENAVHSQVGVSVPDAPNAKKSKIRRRKK